MQYLFNQKLSINPVIAAVKSSENLDSAVKSDCEIVFLLCGTISSLDTVIKTVQNAGKMIFVHIDLIEGLGRDAAAIRYLKEMFHPDGIISTKTQLLKAAAKEGMLTIQRFFILDSISLKQCVKLSAEENTNAVEIMPGIMPGIIKEVSSVLKVPVIVGGLISEEDDIKRAIENGALGISSSKTELWERG